MSAERRFRLPEKLLDPDFVHLLTVPMLLKFAGFPLSREVFEPPGVDATGNGIGPSYYIVGYPIEFRTNHIGVNLSSFCCTELRMLPMCSADSTVFEVQPPYGEYSRGTLVNYLSKVLSPGLVGKFNDSGYDESFRFCLGSGTSYCRHWPGLDPLKHLRRSLYLAYLLRQHIERPGTVTAEYAHHLLGYV